MGVGRSCLSVHYWDVCDLHVNASNFFRTQCMVNVVIAEHVHAFPIMPHNCEVNGSPSSIGTIPQFYPLLVSLLLGRKQEVDTFTLIAALTSVFDFLVQAPRGAMQARTAVPSTSARSAASRRRARAAGGPWHRARARWRPATGEARCLARARRRLDLRATATAALAVCRPRRRASPRRAGAARTASIPRTRMAARCRCRPMSSVSTTIG